MIWFRGATNFEYFGDPAKTAGSRSTDGEASTVGDIGHLDADGYLYLTDRKSYMIISGGVNIYPQETENLLATHPAVLDVAVFGVPSDDLGEEVKAVVQPADRAAAGPELEAELIAFCRTGWRTRARAASSPRRVAPVAHRQAVQGLLRPVLAGRGPRPALAARRLAGAPGQGGRKPG